MLGRLLHVILLVPPVATRVDKLRMADQDAALPVLGLRLHRIGKAGVPQELIHLLHGARAVLAVLNQLVDDADAVHGPVDDAPDLVHVLVRGLQVGREILPEVARDLQPAIALDHARHGRDEGGARRRDRLGRVPFVPLGAKLLTECVIVLHGILLALGAVVHEHGLGHDGRLHHLQDGGVLALALHGIVGAGLAGRGLVPELLAHTHKHRLVSERKKGH